MESVVFVSEYNEIHSPTLSRADTKEHSRSITDNERTNSVRSENMKNNLRSKSNVSAQDISAQRTISHKMNMNLKMPLIKESKEFKTIS